MQSPLTGKEMRLVKEKRVLEYRKEPFSVLYHYYECEDSGEQFTDDALDNLNLSQVYNQYRAKYGIPFVDEIRSIREQYGLSAAKMSEVLGLGANVYRQYEAGEMPSVATGRLIKMAEDPQEFLKLLEIGKNALDSNEYERVQRKVRQSIDSWFNLDEQVFNWLFTNRTPNVYNGYRIPDLKRIGSMVQFFAFKVKPFTTALNKLMFYADFGHYKKYGSSISGMTYHAIQKGPVPANYGGIYNQLVNEGYVRVEEEDFGDFVGDRFLSDKVDLRAGEGVFSSTEIEVLEKVASELGKLGTKKLVQKSHEEAAWQVNVDAFKQINYELGFDLKHID